MRYTGQIHPISAEYRNFAVPLSAIRPITAEQAGALYAEFKNPANIRQFGQKETPYPAAVCYYSPPFLREVYAEIGADIRRFLSFDLVETYYYARLYGPGDQLRIHTDRGGCFVSVSLCFGYDYSPMFPPGSAWPLMALADRGKGPEEPVSFPFQPGDGMLYPGCSAPHWREIFLGQRCGQAFFHWVPKDDRLFGEFYGDPKKRG
ncbi:MAG: Pelagibacter phage [Pseudomonadota bacterium]|jgi:hypothetical protein